MVLRNIGTIFILCLVTLTSGFGQFPLYWVGGSGNWNDLSNWSYSSGGAGGAGIPDITIDAIFDENSFDAAGQVVMVTGVNPSCQSLVWTNVTNNPTFQIKDPALSMDVAGSIRLATDMTFDVDVQINMIARDGGHEIRSNGQQFQNDLIFNGFNGEWTIADDLDVNGSIIIETGTFISPSNRIFVTGVFLATSGLDVTIDLGFSNLVIFAPNPAPALFALEGDFIDLMANNASISLTGNDAEFRLNGDVPFRFGSVEFGTSEATLETTNYPGQVNPIFTELRFFGNGNIIGNHIIVTLFLTNARIVFLENGSTQFINDLQATGTECAGDASLMAAFGSNERAILDFGLQTFFVGPFNFRGIEGRSDGGPISMIDGIDSGNNSDNFMFTEMESRTVYWVGDGGDWNDTNNWSEQSGGMPGACIPRILDDVIFDNNSFPNRTTNPIVTSSHPVFIHAFTFERMSGVGLIPSINIPDLYVTEDITITEEVLWQIDDVYLIGQDVPGGTVNTDNQDVNVIAGIFRNLFVQGEMGSKLRLLNDLNVQGTLDIGGEGSFLSQGFSVTSRFITATDAPVMINVDSSFITISGSFNGLDFPLTISNISSLSGNGAQWNFTAEQSGFDLAIVADIGSVTFTSMTGTSVMNVRQNIGFETLDIMNNGEFQGLTFQIDSLILHPGTDRIYVFNVDVDVQVTEYLQGLNDLCNDLLITTPNTVEQISLAPDIEIQFSYVTIENVQATGGGTYPAGEGSTSIGNTSGWTFSSPVENVSAKQFLGSDIVACGDSMITLTVPAQIETVTWRVNDLDESTDREYIVVGFETEIIALGFTSTGCATNDTINLTLSEPFSIDLGSDREVCQGATELLDPQFSDPSASYIWSTSEQSETINVSESGTYSLTVTRENCTETDVVSITKIELEPFDLGSDTILCSGETLTIPPPDFQRPSTSFVWNTGASSGPLTISEANLPADNTYFIEVSEGICSDADSIVVQFDAAITQVLTDQSDTTLCAGDTFDLKILAGLDSVLWSTGSKESSITVSSADTYMIQAYRGTCTKSEERVVSVTELPAFNIGNDTTLCSGESFSIPPPNFQRPSTNFMWNTGATSGPLDINEDNSPPDNTYFIEVSEGICAYSDSIVVLFDAAIDQVLTDQSDTTLCDGDSFDLKVVPGLDSVLWNTGSVEPSITISAAGTYMVEAFSGACTRIEERVVNVTQIPAFNLGDVPVTVCENEELQLFKPSNISSPIEWTNESFPEVLSTNDTLDIDLIPGTSTDYILTAIDGLCRRSDTLSVIVDEAPDIELGTDTTLCQGASLTLSIPNDLDNFDWSNGEVSTTNVISTNIELSVIAERGRCIVYDTINVGVLDLTALDIGPADTTLCMGDALILNATLPGSVNYSWSPANTGPVYNVVTPGDYQVTVSASGCEVTDEISVAFDTPANIELHQVPGAIDSTICAGEELSYSFNIPGAGYQWSDFQNNALSSNNQFTINSTGGYVLEVSLGVCTTTDSINVLVQELPALNLQDTILACEGEVISLDASVQNASYLWNNMATTATLSVNTTGEYSVIATANNCFDSDTSFVIFNELPDLSFIPQSAICEGDTITIIVSDPDIQAFDWTGPSGLPLANQTYQFFEQGEYIFTATNSSGCSTEDTTIFDVYPTPFFEFPDSTSLCDGNATQLTVNAITTPTRYRWSNTDDNPSIEVRTEGLYYADAFVLTNGVECGWSDTTYVSVEPIPAVELGADAVICSDSLLTLDATVPGASYSWSTGETSATINVQSDGLYSVEVDVKGCVNSDEISITTTPAPVVNIGQDTTICDGNTITLSTGPTMGSVIWSTGETTTDIEVSEGATYSVRVVENGCDTEDDISINIGSIPEFDLGEDLLICDQIGITLNIDLPGTTIQWSTGETGSSINVNQLGIISATATTADGCTFEDEIELSQRECVRFSVYRPNVFAPGATNNTGNSLFKVTPASTAVISSYSIRIFNRWGNLMYESNDFNSGWNGRLGGEGGKLANPGVYSYVIEVTYSDDFDTNRTDVLHGSVTLIN